MNLLTLNDRRGCYPPSLYAQTRDHLPGFAPLQGVVRADVAVVGGGYTGLSAALDLAEAGFKVVLLEAHRVGFGASGRNGGQVGSGQRLDVGTLEKMAGAQTARRLWEMAEEAKARVRELAALANVPYHPGILQAFSKPREYDEARTEADHLSQHYAYDQIQPLDHANLQAVLPSARYIAGTLDHGAGHLDPLKLALGMARLAHQAGAAIHEGSMVTQIDHGSRAGQDSIIHCEQGQVQCRHVILAANGYLDQLDRQVAARVMPINNYIVATEPLGRRTVEVLTRNIAVHDTKFVVNYWRLSSDSRLIFGGGETITYRFPKNIAATVRKPLLKIYPGLADVELTHAWGGTLAITRNRMPNFTRPAPNCLSASGYSGHGVAMATFAGRLMARAIAGQAGDFDILARLAPPPFPGGSMLRHPLLIAGMTWFSLRDRLGF